MSLDEVVDRQGGRPGPLDHLAQALEHSHDAVVGMDLAGTVLSWNRGAEHLIGYSRAEVVGRPSFLLFADGMEEVLHRVREGHAVPACETAWRSKGGDALAVAVSVSPLYSDGRPTGACAVARDISEHRWMAATLDASIHKLSIALGQAQEAQDRCRHFLADVAHQLRTPFAGIRACSETLIHRPDVADQERLFAALLDETARAGRLLDSLLRMARIDEGETISREPTDVLSLCRREVDRASGLSPQIDFVIRSHGESSCLPELDPNAVREIMSNLLDNARRYATSRVVVEVRMFECGAEIFVTNDGPPVPPEAQERIFERFATLDTKSGSGLGLPIARSLATALGGTLTYEDCAFVLRL